MDETLKAILVCGILVALAIPFANYNYRQRSMTILRNSKKSLQQMLEDEDTVEMSREEAEAAAATDTPVWQPVNTSRHRFRMAILGIRPERPETPKVVVTTPAPKKPEVTKPRYRVMRSPRFMRIPIAVR